MFQVSTVQCEHQLFRHRAPPLINVYCSKDDHKTCREFDFPVVLSGHDHHRVDEVVEGSRLLKPGQDAKYATALEVCWENDKSQKPKIQARFVKASDWEADKELQEECDRTYDVLGPLRNTELARVPPAFQPLSSVGSRGKVCTMGRFMCSLIKSALNCDRDRKRNIDAVLMMGGNIRGGTDYPDGSFFSLEALEAEIKADEVVGVIPMPGWLLAKAIQETHAGDPIPGWMQYDAFVEEEYTEDGQPVVTKVSGKPIDPDKVYTVATKVGDLGNGQSPSLTEYYSAHPELLPPKGNYINIHAALMDYFARNLWRKTWEAAGSSSARQRRDAWEDGEYKAETKARFDVINTSGDGIISVEEIHHALHDLVGLSVDETGSEMTLAEFVHGFADISDSGDVTLEDFEIFAEEMPFIYKRDQWRLAYAKDMSPIVDPRLMTKPSGVKAAS